MHFSFSKIAAMILANGVLWTYWITICIPKAIQLGHHMFFGQYAFVALVEMGWLLATVAVAYLFSRFKEWLSDPKIVPIMFKLFALTFVYFALSMGYQSGAYFTR